MAKQKKRTKRDRGQAAARPAAARAKAPAAADSSNRVGLVVGCVIAWAVLFPAFWYLIAPALSDGVGQVPVASTIVGWLPGGAAMVYIGLLTVYWDELTPEARKKQTTTAIVLGAIGSLTFPAVEGREMFVSYYAGLRGSILSMIAWIPLFGVVALARRPFTGGWALSRELKGWTVVAGAVLMLLLAAGPIRYWF